MEALRMKNVLVGLRYIFNHLPRKRYPDACMVLDIVFVISAWILTVYGTYFLFKFLKFIVHNVRWCISESYKNQCILDNIKEKHMMKLKTMDFKSNKHHWFVLDVMGEYNKKDV